MPQPTSLFPDEAPTGARPFETGTGGRAPLAGGSLFPEDEQATRLRSAVEGAKNPDAAARVLRLQTKTGLPTDFIERNVDEVERETQRSDFDADKFRRENPKLAGWLAANPKHAEIAKDDIANLSMLDRLLGSLQRGGYALMQSGSALSLGANARAMAEADEIDRRLTAGEAPGAIADGQDAAGYRWMTPEQRLQYRGSLGTAGARQVGSIVRRQGEIEGTAAAHPSVAAALQSKSFADFWSHFSERPVEFILTVGAESLPQMAPALGLVVAGGVAGGLPLAAAGAGAGSFGVDYAAATLDALREEGVDLKDRDAIAEAVSNKDLMARVGRKAFSHAAPVAAFDAASAGLAGLRLVPARKVAGVVAAKPSAGLAVSSGARAGAELGAQGVVQGTLGAAGEASGLAASGQDLDAGQIMAEFFGEFATAPIEVGAMAATGVRRQMREVLRAKERTAFFEALGEGVSTSATFQRMPEKLREYIAQATAGGPVENIYVPVQAWQTFWQSQEVDPREAAAEVFGRTELYEEAIRTGADIAIPLADYATKIAPNAQANSAFIQELRLRPDEMNAREAAEAEAQLAAQVNAAQDAPGATSAAKVREDIVGQLTGAGFDRGAIDAYASMYERTFATMGERSGKDPFALYQAYNLRIGRPLPEVLKPAAKVDGLDALIDRVRSLELKTEPEVMGESLLPFLRKRGLKDMQGELAGRDVDAGLTKAQRKKQALVREDGEQLSDAMQAAIEAGYFPGGETDITDLLGAIDEELAGRPRYAVNNFDTKGMETRDAVMALAQHLETIGVDVRSLTNAEIKKALADASGIAGEIGDVVFEQGDERMIQVDGKWRPVVNSEGQPIHSTFAGQIAFWRWFGESKVVDEAGRPIVMYHGTAHSFDEFEGNRLGLSFVTPDPEFANRFASMAADYERAPGKRRGGENVIPVYAKADRPFDPANADDRKALIDRLMEMHPQYTMGDGRQALVIDGRKTLYSEDVLDATLKDADSNWLFIEQESILDTLERAGFDAAYVVEDGVKNLAVFDSAQLKSAIGNRGTFDPVSGNILYQSNGFDAWSRGHEVVPLRESHDYRSGEGVVVEAIHGTTGEFTEFDSSAANIESDLGAGFYFTNTEEDAGANYAGFGPDLTNKIELEAERIAQTLEDEPDFDGDAMEEARKIARKKFAANDGLSMPVFVRFDNPVVLGGAGETFLDYESGFDPETEEDGEPTESLISFIAAIDDVLADERYSGGNPEEVVADLHALGMENGGIKASALIEFLRKHEGLAYVDDTEADGKLASTEIVRRAFEAAGFDGIIDTTVDEKFGSQRRVGQAMTGMTPDTVHFVAFKPEQIKSRIGNDGSFDEDDRNILSQEVNDRKRGRIAFGPERQFNIELFARADLSTFIHESGHFYLEVFGDIVEEISAADPTTWSDQQRQMVRDYGDLLEWLGVSNRAEISVEQHEQFARGIEAYMRDGKAPSAELRSVFAKFRAWLVNIYRSLSQLRVELSPEVRAVMDRMFATDQEIEAAEREAEIAPLFIDAATAGMSDVEFAGYRETVQAASERAREELQKKLFAQMKREQQAWWKQEREIVLAEVASEVYARPEYIALSALQRGTLPDGSPLPDGLDAVKLNRDWLVDAYGKEFLKRLPRPYVYAKEGGINPELAAATLGFASGDALVMALVNARPMRQLIEAETDARMKERHGDMMLDGTMAEAARIAVNGQGRAQIVEAELKALNRAIAGSVIPPADVVNGMARDWIARQKVRDLRPSAYLMAAQRAAKEAFGLVSEGGDRVGAMRAKLREQMNLALYREATAAQERTESTVEYMRSFDRKAKRERIGRAGGDFLDQIDGLLDRFEFKKVALKVLERRRSLSQWVADKEAQGLPVSLPENLVDEMRRQNYKEMTVEELAGLRDAVKHIEHLATLKNKLLKAKAKRDLDEAVTDIAQSIREHARKRERKIETRLPTDEAARLVSGFFASHRKLASVVRQFDGFEDGGQAWEYIVRPINDAANEEAVMKEAATLKMGELFGLYKGKASAELYRKRHIAEINASLTKMGRLMIALNWGNEGNRQRVMSGYGWSEKQVEAILATLDARDWQFVQGMWDFIDSYWPQIEAKEKRVDGVAPAKVERAKFTVTIDGKPTEIAGGYFPIKYDDRQSAKAGANLEAEFADLAKQASYTRATTKRGHTEARAEKVEMPIRLDFGVIFEHVGQVIHDLTHHEMLLDAGRLLGHKELQAAIYETYGDITFREVKKTLVDIAHGDTPAGNAWEKSISHLRQGVSVAYMGWNLMTSLQQPLGLFNSIVRVGPKWVAKGLSRWLRDASSLENTVAWVHDRSEFMRLRHKTQQREISEIRNTAGLQSGRLSGWVDEAMRATTFDTVTRQAVVDSYFWMIAKAQQVADVPTWLGAYEKAMAGGETEERAIALADQAVLDSQGGGQIKDLASVQRGGPMLKLWTNFYSFFNVTFNLAAESTRRTNFRDPVAVGRLAVDYLLLSVVPATLAALIKHAITGSDDADDDELARRLARENVSYLLWMMIGLREIGAASLGFVGYEGPAGARFFSSIGKFVKQSWQGDADSAFWKSLNESAGILLHYPAGQIKRTVEGFNALVEGQTMNPLALVFGPAKP